MTVTTGLAFEFAKLPLELRSEVYGYVKPDDWWHEYAFDPRSGAVTKLATRKCSLPALFRGTKWVLLEAVDSLTKGTCSIHISSSKIGLGFPLEPLLKPGRSLDPMIIDEDTIRIPICKTIKITIALPQRMLNDFMQSRRSMADVVKWLNSYDTEKLPRLEVKLENGSGLEAVPNDFAMLVGPFVKLNKDVESFTISSDTGYSHDARVEQQCDWLEDLLNGDFDESTEKYLIFQQAVLDIRLTATDLTKRLAQLEVEHEYKVMYAERESFENWWQQPQSTRGSGPETVRVDKQPLNIDKCSILDIVMGTRALRYWCNAYEVPAPTWLRYLGNVFDRDSEELDEQKLSRMLKEVLLPGDARAYDHYATGLSKGFNPFQLVEPQHSAAAQTESFDD